MSNADKKFLRLAIDEGLKGTLPYLFGAVVVKDGKVIAQEHSHAWERKDPSAHAEICALVKAGQILDSHNLKGCTLYGSHEPCLMCFSCAAWAEIERVVFATSASKISGDMYEFKGLSIYDVAKKLLRPIKVEHIEVGANQSKK